LGRAYFVLGEYEIAVSYLLQAIERNESAGFSGLFIAASYVSPAQIEDAEWEITQMQMVHSEYRYPHIQKNMTIGNRQLFDWLFTDLPNLD
jgi:hypothetical protein